MEQTKKWTVLCGLLAALFVIVMLWNNMQMANYKGKIDDQKATIAKEEGKLKKLEATLDKEPEVELTEEEQEVVLHSATEAGNKVAEIQNKYQGFSQSGDTEGLKENANQMDTVLVEEARAARVPWFAGNVPHTWTFVSDASFEGTEAHVLWVCENDKGEFLGFAKGTYLVDAGRFDHITYGMSRYGASLVGSSGDQLLTDEIDKDEVNDLADAIKNADVPEERAQSDEELTEASDARDQLRKSMEE